MSRARLVTLFLACFAAATASPAAEPDATLPAAAVAAEAPRVEAAVEPAAAESPVAAAPAPVARNLQVLPKNISDSELRSVMRKLNRALGVGCDFCHVEQDPASDENPMKVMSRKRLRQMKKWNDKHNPAGEQKLTCWKCHQGKRTPEYLQYLRTPQDQLRFLSVMMELAGGEDMGTMSGALHVIQEGDSPKASGAKGGSTGSPKSSYGKAPRQAQKPAEPPPTKSPGE